MRVLITSASSPPALALARVLAAEGHTVFAVDTERVWGTAPARYSRAYTQFHRLRRENDLLTTLKGIKEIDLLIPFGDSSSPSELSEIAKEFQTLYHPIFESAAVFQDFVRECVLCDDIGVGGVVKVPAAYDAKSHEELGHIIGQFEDTEFKIQLAPYDEDGDTLVDVSSESGSIPAHEALFVTYATLDEALIAEIEALPISELRPYRLTEVMKGGVVYEAHALINEGTIQTFITTTTEGGLRPDDFIALAPTEPLVVILFAFTSSFLSAFQAYESQREIDSDPFVDKIPKPIAMNLSLTFHVVEEVKESELVRRITVLSCSNRPSDSILLLTSLKQSRHQLALAYTSPSSLDAVPALVPAHIPNPRGTYSLPRVLTEVYRTLRVFRPLQKSWWLSAANLTMMLWVWGLCFQEEMWDVRDPLPALVEWLVRLPLESAGWM